MQPASLWRRAAARAFDTLCMLVLCALAWLAGGIVLTIFAVTGEVDLIFGDRGHDFALFLVALTALFALVLLYRYEVVATARRGQTWGKRLMDIEVAGLGDRDPRAVVLGLRQERHWARWAIPHMSGLVVATIATMASIWRLEVYGLLVGAGAGMAAWTAVYASSLFDTNGRGWHDKAARTMVVTAPDARLQQ